MTNTIEKLQAQIEGLRKYIVQKMEVNDWYGVANGAMDIREFEAQIDLLKELTSGNRLKEYKPSDVKENI